MSLTIKIFVTMMILNMVRTNPATYQNYVSSHYPQQNYDNQKIFTQDEAPLSFESTESPLNNPHKSQEYQDFIRELYRFDKEKAPQIQQFPSSYQNTYNPRQLSYQEYTENNNNNNNNNNHRISKRAIVFRPLFVYKQQTIKKQRLDNNKAQKAQQAQQQQQQQQNYVPANKSPTYVNGQNQIVQQYNPYYYPYQYGQRYPYAYST